MLNRAASLTFALCLFWPAAVHADVASLVDLQAHAQVMPRSPGRQPSRTFTGKGRIISFLQTPDGTLWLGGSEGVFTFDGKNFGRSEGQDHPRGNVFALQRTRAALYVGGTQGLWKLQHGGAAFEKLNAPGNVRALAAIGSKLWVGTEDGVYVMDGSAVRMIRSTQGLHIRALMPTGDDESVWVGTSEGLWKLQRDGLTSMWQGGEVAGVLQASWGTWYAASDSNGLLTRGPDGVWKAPEDGARLHGRTVLALANDSQGNLWMGTSDELVRMSDDKTEVTVLRMQDLPEARIQAVFVDDSQNLWLGFDGNSILQFRRDLPITTFSAPDREEVAFAVTSSSDGSVWMTTTKGIQHWTDSFVTNINSVKRRFWRLRSIQAAKEGTIWAVGETLLRLNFNQDAYQLSGIVLPGPSIETTNTMSLASDGSVWAGLDKGQIVHLTTTGMLEHFQLDPEVCPGGLRIMELSPGKFFIANRSVGACIFDAKTGHAEPLKETYEKRIRITSLARLSNGEMWLGSWQNGVGRLRDNHISWVGFEEGLSAELIGAIIEDKGENVWLAARSGILRISKGQLSEVVDGKRPKLDPLVFGAPDGLISTDCLTGWSNSATRDAQGRLWFVTIKGPLVIEHPESLPVPRWRQPELVSLTINGRPIPPSPSASVTAPVGQGNVVMRYRAMALAEGRRLSFRYQLEGLDQAWVEAGDRVEAFYTNLPAGRYTFRLQAELRGWGTVKDMPPLVLILVPPFYRTVPFYFGAALAIAGLIWIVIRARSSSRRRQQKLLAEERRRISQDIHDSLEQTFVAMRFQVDAARRVLPAEENAQGPLERTMSLISRAMKETRAAIWALRSEFPGNTDLVSQVAIVVGEASQAQAVPVKVSQRGQPFALPVEVERNAVQITREALSNAMKHGAAKNVLVEIVFDETAATIKVSDDGQGFDLDQAMSLRGHYGISGMKERAEQIQSHLDIESAPGTGTIITLTIPRTPRHKQFTS